MKKIKTPASENQRVPVIPWALMALKRARAESSVRVLALENERLRVLLRDLEQRTMNGTGCCSVCDCHEHASDCRLAAALQEMPLLSKVENK